jgi:hypothetical protein
MTKHNDGSIQQAARQPAGGRRQPAARKTRKAAAKNACPAEEQRDGAGRFLPGASGNPQGRPPGARNRASLLAEILLDGQAVVLAQKAVELALDGNVLALRLCLERLVPALRERRMLLQLPAPATAEDIAAGFGKVTDALTNGELTPSETNSAAMLLESARRALETTDLARRIDELEKAVGGGE